MAGLFSDLKKNGVRFAANCRKAHAPIMHY